MTEIMETSIQDPRASHFSSDKEELDVSAGV